MGTLSCLREQNKITDTGRYRIKKFRNEREGNLLKENHMMTAEDVSKELGVSKGHAYKLIRELNGELKKAGYLVIAGKVPKAFWETKFYGYNQPNQTA